MSSRSELEPTSSRSPAATSGSCTTSSGTPALRESGAPATTRSPGSTRPTGEVTVVGGGLAPCGITPDPSGDVWVATVTRRRSARRPTSFASMQKRSTSSGRGPHRAAAPASSVVSPTAVARSGSRTSSATRIQVRRTPSSRSIRKREHVARSSANDPATGFGWSEGYGDLWINHFGDGKLSRLHPATEKVESVEGVAYSPVYPVVDRDTV